MSDGIELVRLDLSDPEIAARLLELQRSAYRVEADLVGSDDIPPLHETFEELVGSEEVFLGALVDGLVVGAVSWKIVDGTLDIHRLFVDPPHFRRGIGVELVRAALGAEPRRDARGRPDRGRERACEEALPRRRLRAGGRDRGCPGLRVARFRKSLR